MNRFQSIQPAFKDLVERLGWVLVTCALLALISLRISVHAAGQAKPSPATDAEITAGPNSQKREKERDPESDDEKAVATLELVFFQDKSRRSLPAVTFTSGDETFALTTGPATVVPDGTPHFKEGRLAGITLLGSRFVGEDAKRLYVVPASRVAAFCRELQQVNNPGDGPRAMKNPLEREVSLAADNIPLKVTLEKLAAQARLEVELETDALQEAGLDLEKPVSVRFDNLPLAKALGRLIDWRAHPGMLREVRRDKLVFTTLNAFQARIAARLPAWMQPLYNRGLLATLDDNDEVASVTTSSIMTDELLAQLKTLPMLRELYIEVTRGITPAGLAHLADLKRLEKLTLYNVNQEGAGLGDDAIRSVVGLASLRELSIGECATTDAGVKLLEQLPQLTSLNLRQEGRLTDDALKSIGALNRLKSLALPSYVATERLGRMQFSAAGIKHLSGLKELETLQLVGHAVPADALAFPKLTSLSLGSAHVDDAVARAIGQLRQLTHLELTYNDVTDAGLKHIATLPRLRHLDISSSKITDAGIEPFRSHPQLEHFSLRATDLTDTSLRYLAQIKTLTRFDLHGSGHPGSVTGDRFSIAGVQQLKTLPRLETLWLTNFDIPGGGYAGLNVLNQLRELTFMMCNVTDAELDELEDALPDADISLMTGGGGRSPKRFREAIGVKIK